MLPFLVELRRRNVLRVAAAYLVAAWLLVQVAATLLPLFGFGEGAVRAVVVLLAVGFVPALVFSWAFEITPEGLKRERDVDREQSIVAHTGRKLDRIIMVVLALALGYFVFDRFALSPSREAAKVQSARQEGRSEALVESYGDKSIAVLPFADMSPGHDQEYFSDGIAEELLNLLAKIPELRVISRSSAFSFRDRNLEIPEIARQLKVAHILEGSVRRDGNRVRITAELIDARSDTHLWSETYDRTMDDIFAVQDEIAAAVVEQLKIELLGATPTARVVDPEAYALEMKARFLGRESSSAALEQSVEFHKQALAIDPSYASAWSELARTYTVQVLQGMLPAEQGIALQRDAIAKALALDPDDPQAHVQLGWAAMRLERDLAAAARHLSRALSLDPANADALRAATALADALGRADEAVAIARYALLNDPVTPTSYYNLGVQYCAVGRFDDSIAALRTALRLSPDIRGLHALIALTLLLKGEHEAALGEAELERNAELRLARRALALHALGRKAESDAALRELEERHAEDSAWEIARVHAFRGEADRAFEWLDRAIPRPTSATHFSPNDPLLVSLHDDPRWLPFLRKAGVAPEQVAAIRFEVKLPE